MSTPFGRRTAAIATPAAPAAAAKLRAAAPTPDSDPELAAYRAKLGEGRAMRLLTPWAMVVSGPFGLLLPMGEGGWIGGVVSLCGAIVLWRVRRAR